MLFDKQINKEKGRSQKEVKDKQKAPQTPVKKETIVQKQLLNKQDEQKPKKTPKLQEKEQALFPSFEEVGKALEKKKKTDAQKEIDTKKEKELKQLYGKKYDSLGKAQKKFLTTNIKTIQSITQRELNYMGYPQIAIRTRQNGANLVEFYLYPNGDISDLKLVEYSNSNALDAHTIELIKRAYKDYPYPDKKTLVRIKVIYNAF